MRLFERRVKKRKQRVTEFQILADDVFVILSKAPRLLIVAVVLFVIATKRREKTDLVRAHQQLTITASDETSYIAANKRLARKPERSKHRDVQGERLPRAVGIAGPHG